MEKNQRNELREKGYKFLRAMHSKNGWRVCMQTDKGGWTVYCDQEYTKKEYCENRIENLCKENEMFLKD